MVDLITFRRLFQSVRAATVKLRSPSVHRDFILGYCSRISIVNLGILHLFLCDKSWLKYFGCKSMDYFKSDW